MKLPVMLGLDKMPLHSEYARQSESSTYDRVKMNFDRHLWLTKEMGSPEPFFKKEKRPVIKHPLRFAEMKAQEKAERKEILLKESKEYIQARAREQFIEKSRKEFNYHKNKVFDRLGSAHKEALRHSESRKDRVFRS